MSEFPTRLRFDFEWRISLATALLLPLLVFLGFWQLQRSEEKSELAQSWAVRSALPAVNIALEPPRSPEQWAYQPVELVGHYLQDKDFLLDNRIQGGQFGYEVLSPFLLDGGEFVVLVNRGWVQGDPARLSLPEVVTMGGPASVSGTVYVPPGAPYLLAEQQIEAGWPKLIQAVEMDKLAPALLELGATTVFPYSVRIGEGQTGSLMVDWQVVNVSPEKHTGYAVQWFTMAVVLGIFYILRSSNLWQVLRPGQRKSD